MAFADYFLGLSRYAQKYRKNLLLQHLLTFDDVDTGGQTIEGCHLLAHLMAEQVEDIERLHNGRRLLYDLDVGQFSILAINCTCRSGFLYQGS